MVIMKSKQQIAELRKAGRIVAETYEVIRPHLKPGVTTAEIDKIAEEYIRSRGAIPSYIGYGAIPAGYGRPAVPPFPATICTALNHVICHGIPSAKDRLPDGGIIGIDIGGDYNGWGGGFFVALSLRTIDRQVARLIE